MSTDEMQKFGKDGMDMAMASFGAWTKNAQAIAIEMTDYSKKCSRIPPQPWRSSWARKASRRRWTCRVEYLKSSYEDFVAEVDQARRALPGLAKEAYKPFEGVLAKAAVMK